LVTKSLRSNMKKQILHLGLLLASSQCLTAQELQELNAGAGYAFQSYYSLPTGDETLVANDAWDLAFSVAAADAGIFINESSGSSMGQPLPYIELYDALSTDFSDQPDPSSLEDFQVFNAEKSWSKGALNEVADPSDPLDLGWGFRDANSEDVEGERVFVVKLRNGQYRKLQVQSLISGIYTFRYANLDGSNETSKTINKAAHAGSTLAYFSFATGNTVSVEPTDGFDLLYCRYITPFPVPGTSDLVPTGVMGVLSGPGLQVAQANGVDPNTASFDDWVDSLSADIDVIGYDWKAFSGTSWLIYQNIAYFVQTASGEIWKINFTDFGGSLTGKAIFEKEKVGEVNAVNNPNAPLVDFGVYPNPARSEANLVFTANKATSQATLTLTDVYGKLVFRNKLQVAKGLNGFVLPVGQLNAGLYLATLRLGNEVFAEKLVVRD
jgi:hypothetical protein